MKAKVMAAGLASVLVCTPLSADTLLGLYLKAGVWNQDPSGGFSDSNDVIDLKNDIGLDSETGAVVSVAVEHFVPIIPNIKVERTDLSFSSQTTLTRSFVFDETTFPAGERIISNIDFSHTDFVLYYELLDNWVSLDFGLNVKFFDGTLAIEGDTAGAGEIELEVPIPMLYGKAQFDLPFTGLSVGGEGSYIGYDGDAFTDLRAFVAYELTFGLGVEVGFRSIDLDVDDLDDAAVDTTFNGAYASLTFHI